MAGISIMIFGSTYAAIYYFYYCRPIYWYTYSIFSFVSNSIGFISMLSDKFHKEGYVWIKGVIFATIGLTNGLSIMNAIYFTLFNKREDDIPWGAPYYGVLFMGSLYLIGVMFYIKQIPEKYYPKKFDIWFNSHSIFHTFVFLAAM